MTNSSNVENNQSLEEKLALLEKKLNETEIKLQEEQKKNEINTEIIETYEGSEGAFDNLANAIIQSPEYIKKNIPNSYIFFKPLHKTGGDFMYLENISENENIITVADCTGHGLAGRAMAMVVTRKIDDLYPQDKKENYKHLEPHETLSKLDEFVDKTINKAFRNGTKSAHNSVEMQFVKYNHKKQIIEFAGSKSNLIYYREQENKIYVIKGDSDVIGFNEPGTDADEFDQHKIYLEQGDEFFMFSDGIPDLFGGEKNKKLGRKGFHKIITQTAQYEIQEEGDLVVKKLKEWSHNFKDAEDDISLLIVEVPNDANIPKRKKEGNDWIYSLNKKTNTYEKSNAEIKEYSCEKYI